MSITYSHYLVLLVLWGKKKDRQPIRREVEIGKRNTNTNIKRLEQKELVFRNSSKQKERVVLISLTDKEIKLREQAKEIPTKIEDCLDVTIEELLQLKNILKKMLKI